MCFLKQQRKAKCFLEPEILISRVSKVPCFQEHQGRNGSCHKPVRIACSADLNISAFWQPLWNIVFTSCLPQALQLSAPANVHLWPWTPPVMSFPFIFIKTESRQWTCYRTVIESWSRKGLLIKEPCSKYQRDLKVHKIRIPKNSLWKEWARGSLRPLTVF